MSYGNESREIDNMSCDIDTLSKKLQLFLMNNGQNIPKRIRPNGLKFFMPSNDHIYRKSVFEIKEAKDILSNKLGVSDWSSSCQTCDSHLETCQGHFGRLRLTLPCFRFSFVKQLENILNCICFYCQNVRISKDSPQYQWLKKIEPKYRMFFILEMCSKYKRCGNLDTELTADEYFQRDNRPNCGHQLINFKISPDLTYINAIIVLTKEDYNAHRRNSEWKPVKIYLTDIYKCVQCIDDETVEMLGLSSDNHPRSHFWAYFPIPSLNIRPQHTYNGLGTDKMLKYNKVNGLLKNVVNANVKLSRVLQKQCSVNGNNPFEKKEVNFYELPMIDITMYEFGMQSSRTFTITSNVWQECFSLAACNEDQRKLHNARIKKNRKTNDNKKQSAIFVAWHKLNLKVAAFQSNKAQNLARADFKNCVSHNMESRYSKPSAKHTRFRGELCGQRLNMSARSVAEGASAYMYPNEVILPMVVCMGLTVKMYVTATNVQQVKNLIDRGADSYPGANYVKMKDGKMIDLSCARQRFDIDINEVFYIHRHLVENDIVLLTRSPALHKLSIIALHVKVSREKVFRLHYSVFRGLALDLDGDEIAIFVPQKTVATQEAKTHMLPSQNIMKDGSVWMNFIFNSIVGAYLMTRDNLEFPVDFKQMFNHEIVVRKTNPRFLFPSNYDYISSILPDDFYFQQDGVLITRGRFIRGVVNAKILNGSKGIVATMCRVYDGETAMNFIYNGYKLFQSFVDVFGHTISIDHVTFDTNTTKTQHRQILQMENKLQNYIERLPTNFKLQRSLFEAHINEHIGYICNFVAQDTFKRLTSRPNARNNGLLLMIQSGSKGSKVLASQLTSLIGQVYVNFQRYKKAYLSYFNDERDGKENLQKHGFNPRSYFLGSDVRQFICNSYSTIESCLLKIKGTAISGTMLRSTALCAQAAVVNKNKQLVDNGQTVLQDVYGNDGYDSSMLIAETLH